MTLALLRKNPISASSVTPIPPCICTASLLTNLKTNPNLAFARLACFERFESFESMDCKAFKTIDLQ